MTGFGLTVLGIFIYLGLKEIAESLHNRTLTVNVTLPEIFVRYGKPADGAGRMG